MKEYKKKKKKSLSTYKVLREVGRSVRSNDEMKKALI